MVRDVLDLEPKPETLRMRHEYYLDEMPAHHRALCINTNSHEGAISPNDMFWEFFWCSQ